MLIESESLYMNVVFHDGMGSTYFEAVISSDLADWLNGLLHSLKKNKVKFRECWTQLIHKWREKYGQIT